MLQAEKRIRWMKFRYDGSSYEIDPYSVRGLDRMMIHEKFQSRKATPYKKLKQWMPPKRNSA